MNLTVTLTARFLRTPACCQFQLRHSPRVLAFQICLAVVVSPTQNIPCVTLPVSTIIRPQIICPQICTSVTILLKNPVKRPFLNDKMGTHMRNNNFGHLPPNTLLGSLHNLPVLRNIKGSTTGDTVGG